MDDDLIFDDHACGEMQRDSITEDHVYTVVGDPDDEYERDDGRVRYERVLDDGRQIVVILEGQIVRTT